MKTFSFFLWALLVTGVISISPQAKAIDSDSCECPKLSCNADCEVEQNLTFYSEKCEGGKRVKSCARPTCVPIQNAPASCSMTKTDAGAAQRAPASVVVAKAGPVVGKINFIEATVKKVVSADKKVVLSIGDEVSEGDRIETDASGKAQILFNSGNQLNLTPNSVIVITEANDTDTGKDAKKRVVLDLIKGRVRNKVNQSYNGDQSYYRIRTGSAVAGVRGTDFVVTLEGDDKNITSKIETLEGKVELSDAKFEQKTFVAKGEGSSFVADKDGSGRLTPVYKMSDEQIAGIQKDTSFSLESTKNMVAKNKVKTVKSEDLPICSAPSAKLNECAWSCENNPSGESKCRTDLPDVSCVRRICNANGVWSQPTRLPAAHHESCKAGAPVVKPCDY